MKKTFADKIKATSKNISKAVEDARKKIDGSEPYEKLSEEAKSGMKAASERARAGVDKAAEAVKSGLDKATDEAGIYAEKTMEGAKDGIAAIRKRFDEITDKPLDIDEYTVLRFKNRKLQLLIPDGYDRITDNEMLKVLSESFGIKKLESSWILSLNGSVNFLMFFYNDKEQMMNPQNQQEIIDGIHNNLSDNQGLIEVKNGKTRRGYDYIYSIVKNVLNNEGMPMGVSYFLRLNLFSEDAAIEVKGSFEEQGTTGIRESIIYGMARNAGLCGDEFEGWNEDPYDPDYKKGIPKNLSEKEGIDIVFPEHPLSQVHEFLYAVLNDELIVRSDKKESNEEASERSEGNIDITDLFVNECRRETFTVDIGGARADHSSKETQISLDDQLMEAIGQYNKEYAAFEDNGSAILRLRERSVDLLENVENLINSIANHPKSFDTELAAIELQKKEFKDVCSFAQKELASAQKAAAGAGAGMAGGMAVASLTPSAAMWVATTFGTASTGTAISALSGAAAQNAALAWIGGGTLAAGGGGTAAGTAFLAMAGPIGWTLGGATLLASIALFANKKRKLSREKKEEIEAVLRNVQIVRKINTRLENIVEKTDELRTKLSSQYNACMQDYGRNYTDLSEERQLMLGTLVNNAKSLAAVLGENVEEEQDA